jgi:hypothetical protein
MLRIPSLVCYSAVVHAELTQCCTPTKKGAFHTVRSSIFFFGGLQSLMYATHTKSCLLLGGRTRRAYAMLHSDQKRSFSRGEKLYFLFWWVTVLDVCYAYQVLFATRRSYTPSLRNVALRPKRSFSHGEKLYFLFWWVTVLSN